jgi:hypothetical protein
MNEILKSIETRQLKRPSLPIRAYHIRIGFLYYAKCMQISRVLLGWQARDMLLYEKCKCRVNVQYTIALYFSIFYILHKVIVTPKALTNVVFATVRLWTLNCTVCMMFWFSYLLCIVVMRLHCKPVTSKFMLYVFQVIKSHAGSVKKCK